MISPEKIQKFREYLLDWYSRNKRDLPWRRTQDPYAIWISEVMLQQTRVAAAIPYYERFLSAYPDFRALAGADEPELLSHWAGLGYYYRARNLQKAAQWMAANGGFPRSYEEIKALPGIGEYTAAAIASIGFGLPYPVVDGNVFRVLSRVLDDHTNIASRQARKHFTVLAEELLESSDPGAFNQAVMELGATVCLPKNPRCLVCPVGEHCQARREGRPDSLPIKTKPKKTISETRTLLWVERPGQILLWQRPQTSRLMPGFWELPEDAQLPDANPLAVLAVFQHGITFHNYRFVVTQATAVDAGVCQWVHVDELSNLPLSTVARKARKSVTNSQMAQKPAVKKFVRAAASLSDASGFF